MRELTTSPLPARPNGPPSGAECSRNARATRRWPSPVVSSRGAWWAVAIFVLLQQIRHCLAGIKGTVLMGQDMGKAADQFDEPMGVAYEANGNLLVADTENHRIQRCEPGALECSTIMGAAGVRGNDSWHLYLPYGLQVASDKRIYVADTMNNKVLRRLNTSEGVTIIDKQGLRKATALVLDEKHKHIYVADTGNHHILRYDWNVESGYVRLPGITYAGIRAQNVSNTSGLNNPVALYLDEKTRDLWIADTRNWRITRWPYNSSVGVAEVSKGPYLQGRPYGVYVSNNALYYADADECVVWKKELKWNVTYQFAGFSGDCRARLDRLSFPAGLHVSHDGALTIADSGNHRVVRWTPEPSPTDVKCTFSAQCRVVLQNSNPTPRNMLIVIKKHANSTCGGRCQLSGLGGGNYSNATRPVRLAPLYRTVRHYLGNAMFGDLETYQMCWSSDAGQEDHLLSQADADGFTNCTAFPYNVGDLVMDLHIDQDYSGERSQCVKGTRCQITISGYALPDDLVFVTPPTTDWKGKCGLSFQNNFLGYRESVGRSPGIVIKQQRPLWNVTKCIPKNDSYTEPCNCSAEALNRSDSPCYNKTYFDLTTNIVVDFGEASDGGPGFVPMCMCKKGKKCTAPYQFSYAAGFLRIRSVTGGLRFFCWLEANCTLPLKGMFMLKTDMAQIRDRRDNNCGFPRQKDFNISHVFSSVTLPVGKIVVDRTGGTGARTAYLDLGIPLEAGRYKVCYCSSYTMSPTKKRPDALPCNDDEEFSMDAGNIEIMHVTQEDYECPVTKPCNLTVHGIRLQNETIVPEPRLVGPDAIMLDRGGPDICGTNVPLLTKGLMGGAGNTWSASPGGNYSVLDFAFGDFVVPGPRQMCYCTSFDYGSGGDFIGACNDAAEFYQPLGTLVIRGPRRDSLPCLSQKPCTLSVPGTRMSIDDRLMLCPAYSYCGQTEPCANVSVQALAGVLAPYKAEDAASTFFVGILDRGPYAICYCSAGLPGSMTPLVCNSSMNLSMPGGIVRVRGSNPNHRISCVAGNPCSFVVNGYDLSKTDYVGVIPLTGTCGISKAASYSAFRPSPRIRATQGTAPLVWRQYDFKETREPGRFRLCYCAKVPCDYDADFHLDAGLLFVKGLAPRPREYVCTLNKQCDIHVKGFGLTEFTDAIQIIEPALECGGKQLIVEGDVNGTGLMNGTYEKGTDLWDGRNTYKNVDAEQYLFYDVYFSRWVVGPAINPDFIDETPWAYADGRFAKTPERGIEEGAWRVWDAEALVESRGKTYFGNWVPQPKLRVRSVRVAPGIFEVNPSNVTTDRIRDTVIKAPYLLEQRFQLGAASKLGVYKICYCPSVEGEDFDKEMCTGDDEFAGKVDTLIVQVVRGNERYHCAVGSPCIIRTDLTDYTAARRKVAMALLPFGQRCFQAQGQESVAWNKDWFAIEGRIKNGHVYFDLGRARIEGLFEVCVCTGYDDQSDGECNRMEEFFQNAGDLTVKPIVRFDFNYGDPWPLVFNLTWGARLSTNDRLLYVPGDNCHINHTQLAQRVVKPVLVGRNSSNGSWASYLIGMKAATELSPGPYSACLCPNWDGVDPGLTPCSSGEEFYMRIAMVIAQVVAGPTFVTSVSSSVRIQLSEYAKEDVPSANTGTPLFTKFSGGRRASADKVYARPGGISRDVGLGELISSSVYKVLKPVLAPNSATALEVSVYNIEEMARNRIKIGEMLLERITMDVHFKIRLDGPDVRHNTTSCTKLVPLTKACAAGLQSLVCYNERQQLLKCMAVAVALNGTAAAGITSQIDADLKAASLPGLHFIAAVKLGPPQAPSVGPTPEQLVCVKGRPCEVSVLGKNDLTGDDRLLIVNGRRQLCGPAPGFEGDVTAKQRAARALSTNPLDLPAGTPTQKKQVFDAGIPVGVGVFTMCFCWRGPPGTRFPCTLNADFYQTTGTLTIRGPHFMERLPCLTYSICSPTVLGINLLPFDRVHIIPWEGVCGKAEPISDSDKIQYSPAAVADGAFKQGGLLPSGELPQGGSSMIFDLGMAKIVGKYRLCYCSSSASTVGNAQNCNAQQDFSGDAGMMTFRGVTVADGKFSCPKADQPLPKAACQVSLDGTDMWLGIDRIMLLEMPGPACGESLQSLDIVPNPIKLDTLGPVTLWKSPLAAPRNYSFSARLDIMLAKKQGTFRVCSCNAQNPEWCTPDGESTAKIKQNFIHQIGFLFVRGVIGSQLFMCKELETCTLEVQGVGLRMQDGIEVLGAAEICGWEHERSKFASTNLARPLKVLDAGLRAVYDVGTIAKELRGQPNSLRLCYCAGIDNDGDGQVCENNTEFTHSAGYINTIICPEKPVDNMWSPPVEDIFGDPGDPHIRLYEIDSIACKEDSASGLGLAARREKSNPVPLDGKSSLYNGSITISTVRGRCKPSMIAAAAKMNMIAVSEISVSIIYQGDESRTDDKLRLSLGHKLRSQAKVVDLRMAEYTCPSYDIQMVPFSCTMWGALMYGLMLHGIILLSGCLLGLQKQLWAVYQWIVFLKAVAKMELEGVAVTASSIADIKPGHADIHQAEVISAAPKSPSLARTHRTDLTSFRNRKSASQRFDKWQRGQGVVAAEAGDKNRHLLILLSSRMFMVFLCLLRIGALVVHVFIMSMELSDLIVLLVAPAAAVGTMLLGQALFLLIAKGRRGLCSACCSTSALHSAAAVAKVHLDLTLPMLARKHHCELWRVAAIVVLCSLVVQFFLPTFFLIRTLRYTRRKVPSSLAFLGISTLCTVAELPEAPDPPTPEPEPVREPSKDSMISVSSNPLYKDFKNLQGVREAWAKERCVDLTANEGEDDDEDASPPGSRPISRQTGASSGIASTKDTDTKSQGTNLTSGSQSPSKKKELASSLTKASSIGNLAVLRGRSARQMTTVEQGWCTRLRITVRRWRWFWGALRAPYFSCAPEERLRHRLVSNFAFLESAGWHIVTMFSRHAIEPLTGAELKRYEARWTMLLTMIGGIDVTVMHLFFAVGYMPRLNTYEALVVVIGTLVGVWQAARPNIMKTFFDWAYEITPGKLRFILMILVFGAVRFVVAFFGMDLGCPNSQWPISAWACSVVFLELPIFAIYRWAHNYERKKLKPKLLKMPARRRKAAPTLTNLAEKANEHAVAKAPPIRHDKPGSPKPDDGKLWLPRPPTKMRVPQVVHEPVTPVAVAAVPEPQARFKEDEDEYDPQIEEWMAVIKAHPAQGHRNSLERRAKSLATLCNVVNTVEAELEAHESHFLPRLRQIHLLGHMELRRIQLQTRAVQMARSQHFRLGSLHSRARLITGALPEAPLLRLVHWSTIVALGRLPDFDADSAYLQTAFEAFEAHKENAVVIPVIHRWRERWEPDPHQTTARQLVIFALWYQRRWAGTEPYFWIDYCCLPCIDEDHGIHHDYDNEVPFELPATPYSDATRMRASPRGQAAGPFRSDGRPKSPMRDDHPRITQESADALLPLVFAASDAVVICDAPDNEDRAWVRLEMSMSYAFAPSCKKFYQVDHKLGAHKIRKHHPKIAPSNSSSGTPNLALEDRPSRIPSNMLEDANPLESITEGAVVAGNPGNQITINVQPASPGAPHAAAPKLEDGSLLSPSPTMVSTSQTWDFTASSPKSSIAMRSSEFSTGASGGPDLGEVARKAVDQHLRVTLLDGMIANPMLWGDREGEAQCNRYEDRARIVSLSHAALVEPTMAMPGADCLRRERLSFSNTVVHVWRLEVDPRSKKSPVARHARTMPHGAIAGRGNELIPTPANSGTLSESAAMFAEFKEPKRGEDDHDDDESETSGEALNNSGGKHIEMLANRHDRNTPMTHSDTPSKTTTHSHVRERIDWEERTMSLYFQHSWQKKEPTPSSHDGRPKTSPPQLGNQASAGGGSQGGSARGPQKAAPVNQAAASSAEPLRRAAASDGFGARASASDGFGSKAYSSDGFGSKAYSSDGFGSKAYSSDGFSSSRGGPNSSRLGGAGATPGATPLSSARSKAQSVGPMTAMDVLLQRAQEAQNAPPESTKPLPAYPPVDVTGEERFHPDFRPPTVLLGEGGLVATQLRANNPTGGLLAQIGAPNKVGTTRIEDGPPGLAAGLSSGGMAITMRPLPVRKGVVPESPQARGVTFEVRVQAVDSRWSDGLGIGFTGQDPEAWPKNKTRPRHAYMLPYTYICGYTGRWTINGRNELLRPARGSHGKIWRPGEVKEGDLVTIVAAGPPADVLRIMVNGVVVAERQASDAGLLDAGAAKLWGVVDVEGSAVSVQLGNSGTDPLRIARGAAKAKDRLPAANTSTSSNRRPSSAVSPLQNGARAIVSPNASARGPPMTTLGGRP